MTKFCVAIPARYGATRLPGKPLRELAGHPLLEHVYRKALESGAEEVIIATDDERIRSVAEGFHAPVLMTSHDHRSGTDRIAELVTQRGWAKDTIVVNLQGDEPLMPPKLLQQVANNLHYHPQAGIATLCTGITHKADIFDPHVVKVVLDASGYALYFSRAPIPYHRDGFTNRHHDTGAIPPLETCPYFRHIGLYAYRAGDLLRFSQFPPCPLEQAESLEQLRALWQGIRIHVQEAEEIPPPGVDTADDLARLQCYLDDQA
jgi:3-deoxy-manno-octulosonate cytidylyltransferase (CMP-KDO synthetase)